MSNTHNTHTQEEWKAIEGYPNYEVSTHGRVRSLQREINNPNGKNYTRGGRILKQGITSRGYSNVGIRNEFGVLTRNVHRLVMETFSPQTELPIINHIDEDQNNNHIDNLEWCSYSHNATHNGANVKRSKKVYQYSKDMELLNVFKTVKDAMEAVESITPQGVSQCATGSIKTHRGYIWSYTDIHKDAMDSTFKLLQSTLDNLIDELTNKKAA